MDQSEQLPRPPLRYGGRLSELVKTIVYVAAVITLANLATVRANIDGPSMQPNLWTGQYLLISRLHYLFGDIQYGDIAVFLPPGENEQLIKRVIGLPGDVIEFQQQQVYRNGVLLDEPYFVNKPCDASHCPDRTWALAPGQYFLMGDNRNHSRDSRVFGPVSRDRIIGKAILRYWPFDQFYLFFDQYNAP